MLHLWDVQLVKLVHHIVANQISFSVKGSSLADQACMAGTKSSFIRYHKRHTDTNHVQIVY